MQYKEMTPEQRQNEFLAVFRRFGSIGKGAQWIADATGSSVATVLVWRCKKRTGYAIPKRPFIMLMEALKNCPEFTE